MAIMPVMRRLIFVVALLLFPFAVSAQEQHKATPVEELIRQFRAANAGHDHLAMMNAPTSAPTPIPDGFNASAAKVFNITAQTFQYTVSPLPFEVNVGDSVTLNIRSIDTTHGFQMERYSGSQTIRFNQTTTVSFIANTAGTFTYFCTIVCGTGHEGMDGIFVVNASSTPGPTVTSFTPTTGTTAGGTSVAITGTGFQQGATVRFGAIDSTSVTFGSATSLTAVAPAQGAGNVAITVTNPDGQSANRTGFIYEAPPAVSIASITPASGSTGGGEAITITGNGFKSGAVARINGVPLLGTVVNATTITGTTPPGPSNIETSLIVDVSVTNTDATSATKTKAFTYILPDPVVVSLSTRTASPTGGTPVTITGRGFSSLLPTSITFDGFAGRDVKVINSTTLSVVAPAHANGAVDVVVTVGNKVATLSGALTYQKAPARRHSARP
jgi:large repetitive protein